MIGKTISHYQILEKLGEGGMGVVYKARDTQLDRFVALKFLHSSEDVPRLLREAKTAASLNHTNICGVHEVAPEHGFIAMELVEGQSLAARIAGRPLPVEEAVGLAVQICEGLKAAHDKGITHRDIKSGNVLVTADGHAKILDFGLARVAGQAGLTREGAAAGTPGYMAPEQMRGEPVDRRTDVWAVGAVLHEMLTGHLPLGQSETLPEGLSRVVRKALAAEPGDRYQHVEDLLVDLRRAAAAPGLKPSRHRWLWVTAALAVLGVVGITLGVVLLLRKRSSDLTGPYTAVPLTSFPGREVNPTFSPDGNQVAFAWSGDKQENYDIYVMLIGTGSVLRLTDDPAMEFSPAWSPDGRYIAFARASATGNGVFVVPALGGVARKVYEAVTAIRAREIPRSALATQIAWTADSQSLIFNDRASRDEPMTLFLASTSTHEKHRLTSPPAQSSGDFSPSVSRSGRRLAFIRRGEGEGHVYYVDLTMDLQPSGEPVRLTTGVSYPDSPAWGADEETLFYSSGSVEGLRTLWRISLSGDRRPVRLPSIGEDSWAVAVSGLRRRMIYNRQVEDSNIYRLPLNADGSPAGSPVRLTWSNRDDSRPRFSPDGRRICFASNRSGNRELWISNSDGSDLIQLTSIGGPLMSTARWSPDGQRLLFTLHGEERGDIYAIRSDGGQPQRLTVGPSDDLIPSWSRDGKWIYFPSNRSGETRIWRARADGSEPVQISQTYGTGPVESTDGKWLYYQGSDGWLWRIAIGGGVETRVTGPVNYHTDFAVTDRGIYFLTSARPGEGAAINFFDFASAKVKRVFTLSNSPRPGLDVSPDGRWLVYTQFDHVESDLMLVENFP